MTVNCILSADDASHLPAQLTLLRDQTKLRWCGREDGCSVFLKSRLLFAHSIVVLNQRQAGVHLQ